MDQKEQSKIEEVMTVGRSAFSEGDFGRAVECFRLATQVAPTSGDAWNALATSLCEQNGGTWTDESLDLLVRAIQVDPKNAKAWTNLADFHSLRGDFHQAAQYMEKVVALDPTNSVSLGNLAMAYRNQGRYAEALDLFAKAVELDPTCGWSRYQLGLTHLYRGMVNGIVSEQKDFEAARQEFRFLEENSPTLQNLPAEEEFRLMKTVLTMNGNSAELRAKVFTSTGAKAPVAEVTEVRVAH